MSTESLSKIIPRIAEVLQCKNRLDRIWDDWGFNQKEDIDFHQDMANGCLYLFLHTREIVLVFMPPGFQMKDLVYFDIVDKLAIQDSNFLMIVVGDTFDKYNYCPAEGRPICRMPFSVFVAPPAHQAINVTVEDASDGDGAKYVRVSLCDVLVLRSLLKQIHSIPMTVTGEKQVFHVITEINLLAPCMSGASHAVKQWCV